MGILTFPLLNKVTIAAFGVLGGLALLLLVWCRWRPLSTKGRLLTFLPAALVGLSGWILIDQTWRPFADPVGRFVWVMASCVVFAATLTLARPKGARQGTLFSRAAKMLRDLIALLLIMAGALVSINAKFGAYQNLNRLFSLDAKAQPLAQAKAQVDASKGALAETQIPGTKSGFKARNALVYLPPGYSDDDSPAPLLVLLAGQPGNPQDWVSGGGLVETMEGYADRHRGKMPVVVVADQLGSPVANPLCSDALLGNAATYLQQDVVEWAKANLNVSDDPARWAIGGVSNGATCALQVVTRRPDLFHTFLSFSGEPEPSLSDRNRTINEGFGDLANFQQNNPKDLMAKNSYPQIAGIFTAGDDDEKYGPPTAQLAQAARNAGMNVELRNYPGGHSWALWNHALSDQIDWLCDRLNT